MQLTLSALVAALCWTYRLTSASRVYTIDEPAALHKGRWPNTRLSPEISRLVLAQRAGVEDYHGADLEDDVVVDAMNGYAAREDIFGERKATNVMILVEGVSDDRKICLS